MSPEALSKWKYLPNILTLLRILLIPVFVYYVFIVNNTKGIVIGLIIFVLASITDYFDGFLARKWNVVSDFGKIFDPLADKLLVLTALYALSCMEPFRLSSVIFWLIFAREFLVTIMREIYKFQRIIIPADKLGKLKTIMQMLGIIVSYTIWASNVYTARLGFFTTVWFWIVTVITIISGLNYLIRPFIKPQRSIV